jgi:hypothetical protein
LAPAFEPAKRFPFVLVILFLVLATGILVAGYAYYLYFENNFRNQAQRQLSSILDLKITDVSKWRKERLSDAEVFYQNAAYAQTFKRMLDSRADTEARKQLSIWVQKSSRRMNTKTSLFWMQKASFDWPPRLWLSLYVEKLKTCGCRFRIRKDHFLDFHREAKGKPVHASIWCRFSTKIRALALWCLSSIRRPIFIL